MDREFPSPRSRTWVRRIAEGVVIGLAGVAISYVMTPQVPPLIDGLAGSWDVRNAELTRRVAARFPAGSEEGAMRHALLDQGFTVTAGEAKWKRSDFPCTDFVNIRWQARERRIVSTGASIFQACP